MATSKARFKWTDDILINVIKYLQEFESHMEFRNYLFKSVATRI